MMRAITAPLAAPSCVNAARRVPEAAIRARSIAGSMNREIRQVHVVHRRALRHEKLFAHSSIHSGRFGCSTGVAQTLQLGSLRPPMIP